MVLLSPNLNQKCLFSSESGDCTSIWTRSINQSADELHTTFFERSMMVQPATWISIWVVTGVRLNPIGVLCASLQECVCQSATVRPTNSSMQGSAAICTKSLCVSAYPRSLGCNKTVRKLFLPNTKWSPSAGTDSSFPVAVRSLCTNVPPRGPSLMRNNSVEISSIPFGTDMHPKVWALSVSLFRKKPGSLFIHRKCLWTRQCSNETIPKTSDSKASHVCYVFTCYWSKVN